MGYKYFTITEICEWYANYVDTKLPSSLLEHMVEDGIITRLPNQRYSLSEVNNLFLQKEDCAYLKNQNDKYIFKENRKILLNKYKDTNIQKNKPKFKIIQLEGNKLKLCKN